MDYNKYFSYKMEKVDFFQVGAYTGNTDNDSLYNKELVNKKIILIEPVKFFFDMLHNNYNIKHGKNNYIIALNFAISNRNGYLDLYTPSLSKNNLDNFPKFFTQLTSTNKDHIINHSPDAIIDQINVPCFTLNTAIEQMEIKEIDYLMIDTEGHDYDILMDLDLTKIKPNKIRFESKHIDGTFLKGMKYIKLINHLQLNGYKIIEETFEDTIMSL